MIFYRCTLGTLALFSNTLEFFLLKLMEIFFTSLFFTQQQDLREGMTLSKGSRGGIWSDFRLCKRILAPSQWTLFCLIPNLVPFLLSPPQMALFPLPFSLGQVSPVPWSSLLENTLSKSCVCFPTLLEHLQRPLLSLTSGLSYWLRHSFSYTSTSCRMFPETWCTDPSPSPSETANFSGSPPFSRCPSHRHPLS